MEHLWTGKKQSWKIDWKIEWCQTGCGLSYNEPII